MSATTTDAATTPIPAPAPPPAAEAAPVTKAAPAARPRRGRRRWHRFAIPLGLVALFWTVTFGAHLHQQPNVADGGTLSPTGTGRHGSSLLAQRLAAEGIQVIRVASTDEAIAAARGENVTIFVPVPDLLDGRLLPALIGRPGLAHIVVARPGLLGRVFFQVPYPVAGRWATATVPGDCADPRLPRVGAAAVGRDRYGDDASCYGGSVVGYRALDVRVTLVGATDPFRNDRFAEADNAEFATAVLGQHPVVVWLDVHRSELEFAVPDIELPEYGRGDRDRTNTGDPLFDAFPELLWVAVVLALGSALLAAVARARRLGPPVPEPLPVVVPASEAVLGRGRLYRRIRARAASLATLRTAAIARIARAIDPLAPSPEKAVANPGPARDSFVSTVAARAGTTEEAVSAILFGPEPDDNAALVQAVADLDLLVAAIIPGARPNQSGGAR